MAAATNLLLLVTALAAADPRGGRGPAEGPPGSAPAVVLRTAATAQSAAAERAEQQVVLDRLRAYHHRLVAIAPQLPARASLAALLRPVMQLAHERSRTGTDPAGENRAALMALAIYVNGWDIGALVPDARGWPRPDRRSIRLCDRGDLARHFILSALISAAGGSALSGIAGLYKEIADSRGGSGFSFVDLAADRAGEVFGLLATRSPDSARRLQSRAATRLVEGDMMPGIPGLPENLSQAELARQFGGVGGTAYRRITEDIDRRVGALPLFE